MPFGDAEQQVEILTAEVEGFAELGHSRVDGFGPEARVIGKGDFVPGDRHGGGGGKAR